MTYNEKKSLYESIMKDVAKIVKRQIYEIEKKSKVSKSFILESERRISNTMFIKALKEYGELTHDDLIKAYSSYGNYDDNPLMVHNKTVDSMYVGRGVGLCLCYKENGREYEYSNQSIEIYDYDDIKILYDYIIEQL